MLSKTGRRVKRLENQRRIQALAWITAICLLGDSMLYVVLPIHWKEIGLSSLWEVGILLSANRLIRLPLNPLIGWLYRSISTRTGVLLAVSLAAITTASYGIVGSFWVLLLMRILWGIAWSFLRLGGYLTVMQLSDSGNRGRYIGTYNGISGIGGLVGMLVGSFAVDHFGMRAVSLIFGAIALLSIPYVIRHISDSRIEIHTDLSQGAPRMSPWRVPTVLWMLVTGLATALVFQGMFNATLSRLIQVHESTFVTIGVFTIGAASLTGILQAIRSSWQPWLAPLIGRGFDRAARPHRVVAAVLLASACLLAMLPMPMPFGVWIVLLLGLQLVISAVTTVVDSFATEVSASQPSKVAIMTAYTVTTDLGASIGPTLAYTLDAATGTASIYWCAAVIVLAISLRWLIPIPASSNRNQHNKGSESIAD
ncbi:MFS transporter [Paenibacillus terrigena]|uniref:MFS transporter n=1 Tax=Paenibacillus terrigena TaxID=369333 RepID=UPI0012EB5FBA|nr:MFS transporter [Paenibacillus terrigena]